MKLYDWLFRAGMYSAMPCIITENSATRGIIPFIQAANTIPIYCCRLFQGPEPSQEGDCKVAAAFDTPGICYADPEIDIGIVPTEFYKKSGEAQRMQQHPHLS